LSEIDEIKNRLDIVEVAGDYVKLVRKGTRYWGCCPFHSEKTPSFTVSSEKQNFHCFGCGKGGDIFTFVQEMEHLDFRETLERLAERAGVKLEPRKGEFIDSKTKKNILTDAQEFFRKTLDTPGATAARAYLKRRNIDYETAAAFGIGWAPDSWNSLSSMLMAKGYKEKELMDSGLVTQGAKGVYDRFRGRVMFPIYNVTDKLIGFGGRAIAGEEAKYLNSPESDLFNKRNNLYLLNKAKLEMHRAKTAILVEGYMDAIRCHLCGFSNAVASLGTALTEQQATLIKRMANLCYICYDSDAAGQEASLRGMYILQKQGVSVKVVKLSGGKDPDEILQQEHGSEKFSSALENALPLPIYHAYVCREQQNDPEQAAAARERFLEGLASLSVFELEPQIEAVAQILGVYPHELKSEISKKQEIIRGRDAKQQPSYVSFETKNGKVYDDREAMLCSLFWNNEKIRSRYTASDVIHFIENETAQNILAALLAGESKAELELRWRNLGDNKNFALLATGDALIGSADEDVQLADKLLKELRRATAERRVKTLNAKMIQGIATAEEMKEHFELAKYIKGGAPIK